MTEIDAVKRRYADLRRMYQNSNIDAVKYLEWKHTIDDEFERVMRKLCDDQP